MCEGASFFSTPLEVPPPFSPERLAVGGERERCAAGGEQERRAARRVAAPCWALVRDAPLCSSPWVVRPVGASTATLLAAPGGRIDGEQERCTVEGAGAACGRRELRAGRHAALLSRCLHRRPSCLPRRSHWREAKARRCKVDGKGEQNGGGACVRVDKTAQLILGVGWRG